MSIPCKFERSILSHDEHELILRSHHPEIMMPDLMTLRRCASVCTICAIGNALWRTRIVGPRVEKERREAETLAWARWRAMTASVTEGLVRISTKPVLLIHGT